MACRAAGFLMNSILTTALVPTIPLPVLLPAPVVLPHVALTTRDTTTRAKLDVDPAVAAHFRPVELDEAADWVKNHPDLPAAIPQYGSVVYPDPAIAKINPELQRLSERPVAPGDGYGPGFCEQVGALGEAEKRPSALELFMADSDEHLEPYLAFHDGMSLGQIVKKFGVADIRRVLDRMEEEFGHRDRFLARAKRAVGIRRRDAGIGAKRAAEERAAFTKPPEPESTIKRGKEWASVEHIYVPRVATAPRSKPKVKDLPWSGDPSPPSPVRAAVSSAAAETNQKMSGKRPEVFERPAVVVPTTILAGKRKNRKRQLEQGLLRILETMPHSPHRSGLVDVVDLAILGMSIPKIAQKLGLSSSSVDRRLREVKAACHKPVAA
jgi:hypothetical protein